METHEGVLTKTETNQPTLVEKAFANRLDAIFSVHQAANVDARKI